MRFLKTKSSGKDQDINVYVFTFCMQELKLLLGICKTAKKNLPETIEFTPAKGRLNNIIKELMVVLKEYDNRLS